MPGKRKYTFTTVIVKDGEEFVLPADSTLLKVSPDGTVGGHYVTYGTMVG